MKAITGKELEELKTEAYEIGWGHATKNGEVESYYDRGKRDSPFAALLSKYDCSYSDSEVRVKIPELEAQEREYQRGHSEACEAFDDYEAAMTRDYVSLDDFISHLQAIQDKLDPNRDKKVWVQFFDGNYYYHDPGGTSVYPGEFGQRVVLYPYGNFGEVDYADDL
ncbi:MAG: hypothetical protein GY928_33790 [Colwellia sp.]|nr:hypothetical protein [Colwellia sp.]